MSVTIQDLRDVADTDNGFDDLILSPEDCHQLASLFDEMGKRLEAAERERVLHFKFDALVRHCERQDVEIASLRSSLRDLNYGNMRNVWCWQGDGEDRLESLSCPVVIPAHALREMIAAQESSHE